ncbi:MAG TPA: efflux RND transporter periplasmic adaptor subunit [Casimicrobiaceae bacterium]
MDLRETIASKTTLLLALLTAAAIAFGAWRLFERNGAESRYRTAPARLGDVTQTVSANGTLNPVVLVNVGTQVSGTVKKLRVDFNDRVQAGQVLLELDPALLEAQVRQDEANLANARASLELAEANEGRSLTLWQQDSIARQAVDTAIEARKSARAQVDFATAQLAKDRTNLDYSVIRSPVSGVVVNRNVDLGQTVAASFQTPTLFQIAQDLAKMQIDTSFAEADIGAIRVGQPVQFTVDAFPNRSFSAKVRQVRLNASTQQNVVTYDVVVAVDNPEQILMPGMTAYVNVVVAQHRNVLTVPNAALRFKPAEGVPIAGAGRTTEDGAQGSPGTVYVLDNKQLRATPVRLGISDGRETEILSGAVNKGDLLVVGSAGVTTEPTPSTLRMRVF